MGKGKMGAIPDFQQQNRIKMRPDIVLESFPLYCPKCKQGAKSMQKSTLHQLLKDTANSRK